mmetsp:Transcript_22095/g.33731  ORF Transcript_22095/g.33731 Transcript_22095/m.33731 type:complete len:317 (-) Transcript_22095:260-1210(-)|eukprot:CAMPEP_0196808836 /NCGR_PEP_ID=MMETSP1362-20130617/8825_1 /TAXON_ID=163516 /ORGANISM="Leptocylindrus danicus, Strain CCMP1856" /LENGTH=316 /DNA_ID=CAMNT_0042183323 /DNA_START=183 /DNA_END=1133 /DNA_ORIENTATION=-
MTTEDAIDIITSPWLTLTLITLACIISLSDVYQHIQNYHQPEVQRHVIRLLFMVPIYAIQSWLSLRFIQVTLLFETLRDLYEAFVIISFVYYIINLLGGWDSLVKTLAGKPADYGRHPRYIFFGLISDWTLGEEFLLSVEKGALQYVVFKVAVTVVICITELAGVYGEGSFDFGKAYIYVAIVQNFSQFWALYCLVMLYQATQEELSSPRDWRPMFKFGCVKGVVFFTWWQGFFIFIIQSLGAFDDVNDSDLPWDDADVAHGIQNYLICIEMFFFAIAHHYVFSFKEYVPVNDVPKEQEQMEMEIPAGIPETGNVV